MILFPAIDLYEGRAVRLLKGSYQDMTVYSEDPVAVARGFREAGAAWIHVVDLEGARDGGTPNFSLICDIARQTGLQVEVGGGVRTEETARRYLDAGLSRVILGTAAVTDRALLERLTAACGDRLAVGVDVKDGRVAIKGWTEVSEETLVDFSRQMEDLGVGTLICTDISRDGAMKGTNRELYRALSREVSVHITASGGVSTMEDVTALRDMGLYGAILGRAIYNGAIDLKEAIEVCR